MTIQGRRTVRRVIACLAILGVALCLFAVWRSRDASGPERPRLLDRSEPGTSARGPALASGSTVEERRVEPSTPAPRGAEPAPATPLRVLVLSERGYPLAEAEVHLATSGGCFLLGETDGRGILEVDHRGAPDSTLVARAAEHVAAEQALPETPGGVVAVELVLQPEVTVRGSVRLEGGVTPAGRMRVSALRGARLHEAERLDPARPDPRAIIASTDEQGDFELSGIERGASYLLLASGGGYITSYPPPLLAEASEASRAEVTVHRVYGCRLRLTGPEGEPLRVDPDVEWLEQTTFRLPPDLRAVDLRSRYTENRMAALPAPGVLERWGNEIVFLMSSPDDVERIGPVKARVRRPGYVPEELDLDLARMSGPEIPDRILALQPDGHAIAPLRMTLQGYDRGASVVRAKQDIAPPGRLRLIGATGEPLQVNVWDLSLEQQEFSVPVGAYRCEFSIGPHGSTRAPLDPPTLVVGAQGASLAADLSQFRQVRLKLVDREGIPYRGQVVFRLGRPGSNGHQHLRMRGEPYVVDGLHGEYRIAAIIGSAFPPPGGEAFQATLRVDPDAVAEPFVLHEAR